MSKVYSIRSKVFFWYTLCLFCFASSLWAQESQKEQFDLYYKEDISSIDPHVRQNAQQLERMRALFALFVHDSTYVLDRVEVVSFTSPKGGELYNEKLSARRTSSVCRYLTDSLQVDSSQIVGQSAGIAWDLLEELARQSDVPYKAQVLQVLEEVPLMTWARKHPTDRWKTLVDSRYKRLMDLKYGIPYNYLMKHYFADLRYSSLMTVYFKRVFPKVTPKDTVAVIVPEVVVPLQDSVVIEPTEIRRPLFALKTNLLFDALTALNVELEVPIKKQWSIMGEWMFPWWVAKDNDWALEIISASLEGRYWFDKHTTKPVMTGWFAGAYVASGGKYDVRWKGKGYQGESYYGGGLTAGYAHTITKGGSLRMEYSLGLGAMHTNYRYYEGKENNQLLVWKRYGDYLWVGPTKLKVSLVWMLHRKKKGTKR